MFQSAPEKYSSSTDDFLMPVAYSADIDAETAVKRWYEMKIHRFLSGVSSAAQAGSVAALIC